jgi:DNA-binding NarL/FixJ family response regulator
MPRKRLKKTEADRAVYRPPARLLAVPKQLEAFADGVKVRGLLEKHGFNVSVILAALAEQARLELVERRTREMQDAWKSNQRPLGPIRVPPLPKLESSRVLRTRRRYQKHREEKLDRIIRLQTRARELQDGLAVILGRSGMYDFERREYSEIVRRAIDGETAKQIAEALGMSERTIEYRLQAVRAATDEKAA